MPRGNKFRSGWPYVISRVLLIVKDDIKRGQTPQEHNISVEEAYLVRIPDNSFSFLSFRITRAAAALRSVNSYILAATSLLGNTNVNTV